MRHRYADKQPPNGDGPLLIYYRDRSALGDALRYQTEIYFVSGKWVGMVKGTVVEREAQPDDEWAYQPVSSDARK